ncbi:MAG: hypothetical protein O7C01_07465, partial [Actinobacteria bacterium]|nr:hypothetical protein [Actinomycetota bacterium]
LEANGRLEEFARHLYSSPATVAAEHVRNAADDAGDPQTVETIGIVARLSALDRLTWCSASTWSLSPLHSPVRRPVRSPKASNAAGGTCRCHRARSR